MNAARRPTPRAFGVVLAWAAAGLCASCAAEPLKLYTLDPGVPDGAGTPLSHGATVIEVRRVSVPDDLDSEDILLRDGSSLIRSQHGRLASRLPVGITAFLTARLAATHPEALVTDDPQLDAPTYRLVVNLSAFDLRRDGTATLAADWLVLPSDKTRPIIRDRTRLQMSGPVAADQDVIALERRLLVQLAAKIDPSIPR